MRRTAAKGALAAVCVAALVWAVDVRGVWRALAGIPLPILASALVLSAADRLLMALKWWHLLQVAGCRVRFAGLVSAYFQSCFISHVLPTALAPELLRVWLGQRLGVSRVALLSSMLLERIGGAMSAGLLASAAILYLLAHATGEAFHRWLLIGGGILAATGVLLVTTLSARSHAWGDRLLRSMVSPRMADACAGVSAAVLRYRDRPVALGANLLLAMLEHGTQFVCLLLLARGLGIVTPMPSLLATIAVVMLIRRVASQLDSWGVTEGLTVIVYSGLALTSEQAVALTIANTSVVVVANLPGAWALKRQLARGPRLREILGGATD